MEDKKTRLKPIIFGDNKYSRGARNETKQLFLLKALQVTQDPKKLREMMGVKTVAEVYRTLDKLSMRKEYHEALSRKGISFDFIVGGMKDIATSAEKDDTRLKAFQTLLKSVGMDTYKESDGGGSGSWEEVLLQKIEEDKVANAEKKQIDAPKQQYEVNIPEVPESVKKMQDEEKEILSSIYDSK